MKLNVTIEEISNGKLYDINDMAKVDTHGCVGCSACCYGAGETIVLNPFDMYQITAHSNLTYGELLGDKIGLHYEEKLKLVHLKMSESTEGCGFLDENQRCSIHSHRPGICRLFPFGRYYEDKDFKYFFQEGDCIKKELSKIKVKKWIGIENYQQNKQFILTWHRLLKALQWRMKFMHDEGELKEAQDYLISAFFEAKWPEDRDFYEVFEERLAVAKGKLGVIV